MSEEPTTTPAKPSDGSVRNLVIVGLATSIGGTALWSIVAAVFPDTFTKSITLPLWGYLTILSLVFVGFGWGVAFFRQQLKQQAADYEETLESWVAAEKIWESNRDIQEAEHEAELGRWAKAQDNWTRENERLAKDLAEEREFVFDGGLYYRATDTDHKQPFCRVCWEAEHQLTTVVDYYEDREGERYYNCSACERGHKLVAAPSAPEAEPEEFDGEEIPF